LGWRPGFKFEHAIEETIDWYLNHMNWVDSVRSGDYRNWIKDNYEKR
ncbi:MAG: dTDP-glucose 4,6-dehydratase, partial [Desulfobacterales bacterium]|nr:dTDP-glucose 4,6-dehydratase [Desulfobacterales bacterium]